jgi:hypothetical protein
MEDPTQTELRRIVEANRAIEAGDVEDPYVRAESALSDRELIDALATSLDEAIAALAQNDWNTQKNGRARRLIHVARRRAT